MLEGMLTRQIPLLGVPPQPQGLSLKAGTFSHLLEVLEDAQVVGQVCGQDDVPHQVQHALIVLGGGREISWPLARQTHSLPGPEEPPPSSPSPVLCQPLAPTLSPPPWPCYLPGEVVEDVATMGVENGDGLSKVVSLVGERSDGAQMEWGAPLTTDPKRRSRPSPALTPKVSRAGRDREAAS